MTSSRKTTWHSWFCIKCSLFFSFLLYLYTRSPFYIFLFNLAILKEPMWWIYKNVHPLDKIPSTGQDFGNFTFHFLLSYCFLFIFLSEYMSVTSSLLTYLMWLIWHFIYSVNHSRQVEWRSLYMADTWSVYTINNHPWPFHIMMSVVRTAVWVSFYGLPTWKCFAISWDWKQSFIVYGNGYFLSVRGRGWFDSYRLAFCLVTVQSVWHCQQKVFSPASVEYISYNQFAMKAKLLLTCLPLP